MEIALLNNNGLMFLLRWLHFFFGIIWIGHLYYFNFTQGPFFAETDATTKSNATQKLVPRALWWFRWGAAWTAVTGLLYLGLFGHMNGSAVFASSLGISILTGGVARLIMAANAWWVNSPAQQVRVAS